MNRREKARQRKRKERERRLRQQRHAAQANPAAAEELEPEADDELADEDAPAEDPDEAELAELLAPFEEERLARRIARALDRGTFRNDDARERATAELAGRTPDELDAEFGPDPVETAQDLAFQAYARRDPDTAERLARQALEHDPACLDARMQLALLTHGGRRLADELAGLVEQATRTLGGDVLLIRLRGHAWDEVRARPMLRARYEHLQALIDAGRSEQAIAEAEALLELDPQDHQQIAPDLCGLLLERDELPRARALLDRFRGVESPTLVWAEVLERFLAGDRRAAARIRRASARLLPQVEELILGRAAPAELHDPDATPLDVVAADAYRPLSRAWARHREARRWLADGALASTAAERRAVAGSYRPPVAALLRLGEPTFGGPGDDLSRWRHETAGARLGPADVPELLRMADDPALHEQDGDEPPVWAPVHAWRALALMAAQGVTDADRVATRLLIRMLAGHDDDWTFEDAVHVIGLVGAPAFDQAADIVLDRGTAEDVRVALAEGLAVMVERDAALGPRVVDVLHQAIREVLDELAEARKEGTQVEEIVEYLETGLVGYVVAALARVRRAAGTSVGVDVELVRRAFEAGIVDEMVCGNWDAVSKELAAGT